LAAGYNRWRAENGAWGQASEAAAVVDWMQNNAHSNWGHRNAILKCAITNAGAAHLAGGVLGQYWVLDMGTR
jgi:uncharacterized protein YkwD